MSTTRTLNIYTDFLAQMDVEQPASTTGTWGASTGLTGMSFRISATRNGSAIGSLTASATERSGTPGRYYAVFDAADLTSDLTDYLGATVFCILSQSGNIDAEHQPLLVADNEDIS